MNAIISDISNVKAYNAKHRHNFDDNGKFLNNIDSDDDRGKNGRFDGDIFKRGKEKNDHDEIAKDHSHRDDIYDFCKKKKHWKKNCFKYLWHITQKKSRDNNKDNNSDKDSGSRENNSIIIVNYNWKQVD